MSYIPQNPPVYLNAYVGCLAGLGAAGKFLVDSAPADYAFYAQMADAFAQEVDGAWSTLSLGSPTSVDTNALRAISAAVWQARSPLVASAAFVPGNYSAVANGVIALVIAGDTQLAAEGIVPGTGPVDPQPAALQGTLFVDPTNSTGVATATGRHKVTVDGLTGPVYRTYANLVSAWGTNAPTLNLDTLVKFLSAHTDNTDPVVCNPFVINDAKFTMQASLVLVVAGLVLSNVTAKNQGSNQLLQASLGAKGAANQLVVNTTTGKASRAWVDEHVSGTTFSLSQPCVPLDPLAGGIPVEVDTWANTDTVDLYTLTAVNLVEFQPIFGGTANDTLPTVNSLAIFDPGGGGLSTFDVGMNVSMTECLIDRVLCYNGDTGFDTEVFNCNLQGGINGGTSSQASYFVWGGILGAASNTTALDINFDVDIILNASVFLHGTGFGGAQLGLVYVKSGFILSCYGYVQCATAYGAGKPVIYGGGTLNSAGRLIYATGQSAVTTFPLTGGLQINSLTTAYSASAAQPTVIEGGIALNPTNLDAAQGVGGFGGNAFNLRSGASIAQADNF